MRHKTSDIPRDLTQFSLGHNLIDPKCIDMITSCEPMHGGKYSIDHWLERSQEPLTPSPVPSLLKRQPQRDLDV